MQSHDEEIPYERYEMIDGIVYDMSPSPSRNHQWVLGNLYLQFGTYLRGKQCQVFIAPFGVWFREQDDREHVEPDLVVVCDRNKIHYRGCVGAPDLVVEILSPSTGLKDRRVKLPKYAREGVTEYWIVDTQHATVEVYRLGTVGHFDAPSIYGDSDIVEVSTVPGLTINLAEVFYDLM